MKDHTETSRVVWDEYYKSCEAGHVGCMYPSESLVRIVSTLRKGIHLDNHNYFDVEGSENSIRTNFSGRALELGFGHLSNLRMMCDKGFECTGLEVSQDAVNRANTQLIHTQEKGIKVALWSDLMKLPYADSTFDFIYGLQCIYYNVEIENIISEVYRVLKPGGHFAFSFFSSRHDYTKYTNLIADKNRYQVVSWSDDHPSYRIRGAVLVQPKNEQSLSELFSQFKNTRVFLEESTFSPLFESWWYIYGQR